jgi:uncharacterized protein YjbI with pentapeptide repeats
VKVGIMTKRTNRMAWRLAVGLGSVVLAGAGLMVWGLRCYWVAKHQRWGAQLQRAFLPSAPLRGVYLHDAKLQHAHLVGVDLSGALLAGSNLHWANLTRAKLRNTHFGGAILCDANLSHSEMTHAFLYRANLSGATLIRADLRDTHLVSANFRRTNLTGADLGTALAIGTRFQGADLRGADLARTKYLSTSRFTDARYDVHTRWPKGFDPVKAGAVMVR